MESWGLTFSSSYVSNSDMSTVVRIGYSEGDAAQMRCFVAIATSIPARGSDRLLIGAGWGSPPDIQVTINPSFNSQENIVYMYGLRLRFTF